MTPPHVHEWEYLSESNVIVCKHCGAEGRHENIGPPDLREQIQDALRGGFEAPGEWTLDSLAEAVLVVLAPRDQQIRQHLEAISVRLSDYPRGSLERLDRVVWMSGEVKAALRLLGADQEGTT